MSTDTEAQLWRLIQNPLQSFEQWKPSVQMLLETPEPELAHIEVAKLLLSSEMWVWPSLPTAARQQQLEGAASAAGNPSGGMELFTWLHCSTLSYFLPSIWLTGVSAEQAAESARYL